VNVRFGALMGALGPEESFRYVSAIFVHFGILHIGLNLLALAYLAQQLEPALGTARYIVLFVVSGALGFVVSNVYYGVHGPLTGGASGALFGLVGAFLAELHVKRDPRLKEVLLRFGIYAVILALVFPVNNAAHLGGLVSGFGLGQLFARETRAMRLGGFMTILAAVCLLAVFGSLAASHASDTWKQLRVIELQSGVR
jgi:rhomboid protease GluP